MVGRCWQIAMMAVSLAAALGIRPAGAASADLFVFTTPATQGATTSGGLIADGSGNLYGTTVAGGAAGDGTVYELSPPPGGSGPWIETVLYSFAGGTDGSEPQAGVVLDGHGNLYGTTYTGGFTPPGQSLACGTVFELSPPAAAGGAWSETVLHRFNCTGNGALPSSGVVFDGQGNLYGTLNLGLNDYFKPTACGGVFELSPPKQARGAWTETLLHSFTGGACQSGGGGTDGESPTGGVVVDAGGNLFGTTLSGGMFGSGAVFELSPPAAGGSAWTEAVIYSFAGATGTNPFAGVVLDGQSNIYGTTLEGGAYGDGTAFMLSPPAADGGDWTETILYQFSPATDGSALYGLTPDAAGNLYGTTVLSSGVSVTGGTVFRLSPPAQPGRLWIKSTFAGGGRYQQAPTSGLLLFGGVGIGTSTSVASQNRDAVYAISPAP